MNRTEFKRFFEFRWKPNADVLVVLASCLLVTASLYTATVIVGSVVWGGMAYFALYGVLTACLFGLGIPLLWVVRVRKEPLSALGITRRGLALSLGLQVVLTIAQFFGTFGRTGLPQSDSLLPLTFLALAVGLFEAVFWRGWVLQRLEKAFGAIPALLLGSALYALYHIGYAMPVQEITFLFFIGLFYGVVFFLTRSIFILWPFLQPSGQLVTLVRDGLSLPAIAALGFGELLILMIALIWLLGIRLAKKPSVPQVTTVQ